MNRYNLYSELLYARPSFLVGFVTMFDSAGALDGFNESRSPAEADANAFQSDLDALAEDARVAVGAMRDSDPRLR